MGEMDDFELETVMDYEDMWLRYTQGEISDDEAYEKGLIDEHGEDHHEGPLD